MLRRKTTFVIGAGAGFEINMPMGDDLVAWLKPKLFYVHAPYSAKPPGGDPDVHRTLSNLSQTLTREDIERLWTAARTISDGMDFAMSIDNFIDIHRHDPFVAQVGKIAISRFIIQAEHESFIYIDPDKNPSGFRNGSEVRKSWLRRFAQLLSIEVPRDDIKTIFDNIQIINFNYDRCVEHFLYHALQTIYHINSDEAAELMSSLKIIHPYGQVGSLPWQNPRNGVVVPFGVKELRYSLPDVSRGIKTFTEKIEDPSALSSLKESIWWADRIVFLGFGFHHQNVDLITPVKPGNWKHIIGTALNVSESDQDFISSDLEKFGNDSMVKLEGKMGCNALIENYWRTLSR